MTNASAQECGERMKIAATIRPLVYEGTVGEFTERFVAEAEGKPLTLVAAAVWGLCSDVFQRAAALTPPDDITGAGVEGWRPIETAPKDRTRILVQLRNPLPVEGRSDLDPWHGIPFVARHPGVADDGFDIGWNFAAPVGQGGFPDSWMAGWMPLPIPSEEPPHGQR